MAVKKTNKKAVKKTVSIKSKSKNGEKNLSEKLQLKLKKSEERIIELNEKYKKIIEIQKQKLENRYKKAEEKYKKIVKKLEDNLKKSDRENSKSEKSSKSELDKLQKKIKLLERKNAKLEAEKIKAEEKISKTAKIEKDSLKDSLRDSIKEIKELRKKLKESEEERKELTFKLKEAISELKKLKNNKNDNKKNKLSSGLSKEEKEQFKENLKTLKKIKKENKILDRKRELLKKEAQKVKAIRSNIKESAKNIASTIRNSQVNYYGSKDNGESNLNPEYPTDSLNITDTEEGLKKLAAILCAAMDDYREQKDAEEKEKQELSAGEERLNKAAEQLEAMAESEDNNLKRPFTIIDKIENSRVEINEGYSQTAGGQTIVAKPHDENALQSQSQPQSQIPNITVKVEAPKESSKLAKPETQLKPASETPTMRMKLLDDTDDYEKKLVITYGFDNMPENTYYSKYKRILRNAARISLLGNLQEGLEMFKLIRAQNIPDEYKQMIDKNIQDITYYLRGLHRVRIE